MWLIVCELSDIVRTAQSKSAERSVADRWPYRPSISLQQIFLGVNENIYSLLELSRDLSTFSNDHRQTPDRLLPMLPMPVSYDNELSNTNGSRHEWEQATMIINRGLIAWISQTEWKKRRGEKEEGISRSYLKIVWIILMHVMEIHKDKPLIAC